MTNQKSFDSLKYWSEETRKNNDNCKIMIVGCKSDLQDKIVVDKYQVRKFCEENNFFSIETSSKNNINLDKCFVTMNRLVLSEEYPVLKDYVSPFVFNLGDYNKFPNVLKKMIKAFIFCLKHSIGIKIPKYLLFQIFRIVAQDNFLEYFEDEIENLQLTKKTEEKIEPPKSNDWFCTMF